MKITKSIRDTFKNLKFEKNEIAYVAVVLFIFVVFVSYNIIKFPIYVDEAQTYLFFTSKGLLASITQYPAPNNHIFFSVISNLFYYLPFDPKISLRLPVLIMGVLSSLSIYVILRKMFDFKTAVIPHILFTFSYPVLIYSVYARGYILIVFFTAICFYCAYKMLESDSRKYFSAFSICSILGFYTIPTFLYVSVSFALFLIIMFVNNPKKLLRILKYYFIITISVGILYTPMIYYNGLDALVSNSYIVRLSFHETIVFFQTKILSFYNVLTSTRNDFIIFPYFFVLLLILIYSKVKLTKKTIILVLLFFFMPFFFMAVQRVVMLPRVRTYLMVPFVVGLAVIINFILNRFKIRLIYLLLLCFFICAGQLFLFKKSFAYDTVKKGYSCNEIAELVLKNNYHSFYFSGESETVEMVVEYYYVTKKDSFFAEKDYNNNYLKSNNPLPLTNYDCIIINRNDFPLYKKFIPENYSLIYNKYYLNIYGKNQ